MLHIVVRTAHCIDTPLHTVFTGVCRPVTVVMERLEIVIGLQTCFIACNRHLNRMRTYTEEHSLTAYKFHRLLELIHSPCLNHFVTARSLNCLLYTSPSPRDGLLSRMPSSA